MPESLKDHYLQLNNVNFARNVESAMKNKSTGFAKVSFKSKKVSTVEAPEQPRVVEADSWVQPAKEDVEMN
jgi:hypothetical protein